MIFLLAYLSVGVFILAIFLLSTPFSRKPDTMVKAMAGRVSQFDKILAAFITPLIGCLFGVVAWPLVLVWKVKDMRSNKASLALERDFPQPTSGHHGNPLIHARINGKIVTKEEWDAARTQASGLPDSVAKAIAAGVIEKTKRNIKVMKE